jgi:phage FluMu protein Com
VAIFVLDGDAVLLKMRIKFMSSHDRTANPARACSDCRCTCGSLVARRVGGSVEIKCRRCQRVVRVPLAAPEPTPGEAPPGS